MSDYLNNSAIISIRNSPKGTLPIFRNATRWACGYLLGKRLADVTSVHIFFLDNLCSKHFVVGDCGPEDDTFPPRLFVIRIDKRELSLADQLKTLFHEIIHVKQFAKGELYNYEKQINISRWMNRKINTVEMDYTKLPWEREAYRFQEIIIKKWAADTGYKSLINIEKNSS